MRFPLPPSILIADDDMGMIRLVRTTLEAMGAKVRFAHDAVSALVKIHESPPDLIILDINMPAGNGLGLGEMLAGDSGLSRVPIIFLTGESSDYVRNRCLAMGGVFVQKGTEAMSEIKRLTLQILAAPAAASKSQLFIG